MAEEDDDNIVIDDTEVQRNLEDINDQAFEGILAKLNHLMEIFRSDAASVAVAAALDAKDITTLRDYIARRNSEGFTICWDLIRFVQNMRQP